MHTRCSGVPSMVIFNHSCIISLKPVIIAFDENMSNNFKPEMPFKTKLSVTTPDGEPANDVQISLKIEFVNSTPPLILNTVSKSGMAVFDIPGRILIGTNSSERSRGKNFLEEKSSFAS